VTVRSNPSIERTASGTLRVPPTAAHVERYASAFELPCSCARLALRSVPVVRAVLRVAVPRIGRAVWLPSFFAAGASHRVVRASRFRAARSVERRYRAGAERPASCRVTRVPVNTTARMPRVCRSTPGSHNLSFERTNNGGHRWAVCPAERAPLFAAQLQR
jgi:hypothetical protein